MDLESFKDIWLIAGIGALIIGLVFSSIAIGEQSGLENVEMTSEELMPEDSKEKTVYFHNETGTVNGNTVDTMNTTMGDDQHIESADTSQMTLDWYLDPPFAGNFTLNGTASAHLWIYEEDVTGGRNEFNLSLELIDVSTGNTIVEGSEYYEDINTVFDEYSVSTEVDEYEIPAGSTIQAVVQINPEGKTPINVAYGDSEYPSRLEVETEDYLEVNTSTILDSEYNESYDFRQGANDTTINFNASITDPFGGYDIRRVNLTLEGPEGVVFYREPMAKVSGDYTSYRSNYTFEWNYSGAPEGEYTAIVSAVDNTGYHYRYPDNPGDKTYGGHLESMEKDFWIGAERYSVHFKTLDSSNMTMDGAKVSVYSSPGMEEVTSNMTNEEGITNISVTDGEYIIRVSWEEVMVNETSYQVSGNVPYGEAVELNCTVYNSTYEVLDSRNNAVEDANLFIQHPNGTFLRRVTDKNGLFELKQTPIGDYTIRTEWLGREVEYTEQHLNSTENTTLEARIYYLDIKTVDSDGHNVSDVHVSSRFNDTERLADAKLTNITGETTMRLPGTSEQEFGYDLSFQWRGVDVGRKKGETLEVDRTLRMELEIYYIDFNLTDSIGEDLEDATLNIYNLETDTLANSGVTDEKGNISMRLPRGPHQIMVTWRGLEVNETNYEVTGDDSLDIECAVYYVDFTAVDSRNKTLSGPRITVSHPDVGLLNSEVADEEGNASMRLPGASLDVQVDWRGVTVFSENVAIDSNEGVLLQAEVYYLQVDVVDDLEEPLENARVELYHDGSFLDEVMTNQSGVTDEIRLPGTEIEGKIGITVSWKGVQVYEDEEVDLVNNRTEEVKVAVYHVTFSAEDDLGESIPRARLRVTHKGGLLLSGRTNEEGNLSSRIPEAVNRVTLDWHGITVYEEDMLIDASEERLLEVEAVHRLNYTVIDSRDEPLERASLDFYVEGNFIGSKVTDSNGFLTIRVPTPHDTAGEVETYGLWRDVLVYEENFTIDSHQEEDLRAEVYYLDYTVVDDEGKAVENAKVIGQHSELPDRRNIITDRLTDEDGYIEFRLPRGEQQFTVDWRGITIYQHSMNITSDVEEEIPSHVYYLTMDVVDDQGEALRDAFVRVTYEDTPLLYHSGYTGEDGSVKVRIPRATWDTEVRWMNQVVYEEKYDVNTTEEIEVQTTVYYLTMNVVDDEGKALEGAYISLDYADTGEFYHAEYTDTDGKLEIKIPEASWDIEVEWKSITVYEEEYEVTTTEEKEISASVYYLSMDVVDDRGESLETARVRLNYADTGEFYNSKYTDEEGKTEFRIPEYKWDVEIKWLEISVYEETHEVNTTEEIEVETSVYHVSMDVVDAEGIPLEDAQVNLRHPVTGEIYSPLERVTDDSGEIQTRVPEGTWNMEVQWKNTVVHQQEYEFDSTVEEQISTDVYYLTVRAEDADGETIDDVHVRVTSRQQAWTGYTSNGTAEFRLPARDDYEITSSYRTTHLLTQVDLQQSEEVSLSENTEQTTEFKEYPMPFYNTILFYLLLIAIVLVGILVVLYSKKGPLGEEELEEETEEEEIDEVEESEESEETEEIGEEDEFGDFDDTNESDDFEDSDELDETEESKETDEFEEDEFDDLDDTNESDDFEDSDEFDETEESEETDEFEEDEFDDFEDSEEFEVT